MALGIKDNNLVDRQIQTTLEGSEHLPQHLIKGKAQDFSPGYNGVDDTTKREIGVDPDNNLMIRGAVHTDELSTRVNFANTSLAVSLGSCSVAANSPIVTGTGFLSLVVDKGDYFKFDADGEAFITQIESIDSDTQLTLVSNYDTTARTAQAASRWIMKTVTGAGDTVTVASGQCIITSGTTANAVTEVKRLVDFSPVNLLIGVSASQRIANQEIFIGFRDPLSPIKYFQWFRLTGTTNTVLDIKSGYNPTTAPSAAETATITSLTLPDGLTTASIIAYRIESSFDRVRFYARSGTATSGLQETLIGEIVRVAPHPNDPLEVVVRKVNGATPPASSTTIAIDFLYAKNFNKLQVEQSGNQEGFLSIPMPGQTVTGSISANGVAAFTLDCSQIKEITLQSTGTWNLIATFQVTNDPAGNWNSVTGTRQDGSVATTGFSAATNMNVKIPLGFKYFRVFTTAYTSGTINIVGYCTANPSGGYSVPQAGSITVQPGNTANTTAWLVTTNNVVPTTGGHSTHHTATNTAASAMPTSVKATAGVIGTIEVSNSNATTAFWFKIFNKGSAPTLGTDTPVKNVRIPANTTITIQSDIGIRLATGIAYAVTATAPLLATGTIATADDIQVNISYT